MDVIEQGDLDFCDQDTQNLPHVHDLAGRWF